jgi:hypothetical protein
LFLKKNTSMEIEGVRFMVFYGFIIFNTRFCIAVLCMYMMLSNACFISLSKFLTIIEFILGKIQIIFLFFFF